MRPTHLVCLRRVRTVNLYRYWRVTPAELRAAEEALNRADAERGYDRRGTAAARALPSLQHHTPGDRQERGAA